MSEFTTYYGRGQYNGARVVWSTEWQEEHNMDRPIGCIDDIYYATLYAGRIGIISAEHVSKIATKMDIEITDPTSSTGREVLWNALPKRD